jgi:hypothetical protein
MQNKDTIYVDVEDDITAIIGKVKNAKEKIVALVPPKRTGVLQSSVNLKLLARAANNANKRLVIITSNAALSGLAASAEIPVAKNLHSKPAIAKAPSADDDEEEVIDGEQLPVGEHAGLKDEVADKEAVPDDTIEDIDIDGEPAPGKKKTAAVGAAAAAAAAKAKKGIKVPDFGMFRKKAALIAAGGVLLILFLIWANVVAPHATVVVSAKTLGQTLSTPVTLGTDLTTSSDQATIKTIEQTDKQTQTIDFDATGTKDIGDKATGTVKMSALSLSPTTVPAGTILTDDDSGLKYVTNSTATIPMASFGPGCFPTACASSTTVGVSASEGGTKYNGASGSLSGAPSNVSSNFTGATSGGTEKIVQIVLQTDVEKAKEQMAEQNKDDAKVKLRAKFAKTDVVIDNSFTSTGGDPASSPDIGQEAAGGKAKLTSEVTYKMTAISKDELDSYLDSAFGKLLTSQTTQRVYDNGRSTVKFEEFKATEKGATTSLSATGQIGPKINDDDIKEQAKGKRAGEVIADIKAIDGVSDVNVKLSPFWVQGVPDDVKKISIEFKLLKS